MPLNTPLVSLLLEPADPARPVAVGSGPGGNRSHAELLADVFALHAEFSPDRGAHWLVECEDAYRVGVVLLAAAATGARVALPPNLQPGTLGELRSRSDRVFVDVVTDDEAVATGAEGSANHPVASADGPPVSANRPAASANPVDPLAPGRRAATSPAATAVRFGIDRHAPLVDLYTSGSSGPGKLVTKALCHLEDEVVELERGFGAGLERDAVLLATVPAHHLYGLLFRVLWPLAASRPFCRTSFLLPDELLARVAETPHAVVVSSPAHLRHLAASPRAAEQRARLGAVFSSGGPLETATALALEEAVGFAPIEIFGSTETGGVASRRACRNDPSPRWSLFAPVTIDIDREDGCLVVTSPFVTAPGSTDLIHLAAPQRWRMGDRAESDGDGFRLLGRSDRIAKVGEKTLSLPEIEAWLAGHELVESATVGTYADKSGPRLGAIVVLNATGRRRLAEDGRRALQGLLADRITERWNRVAVPRRWRFRDASPTDARGKLTAAMFEEEVARPIDETFEPLLVSQRQVGNETFLELVVPRDLAYLEGHYEAFPLVPGVVQIHWVMSAIGRVLGRSVSAQRMEAIKFKNVLRPAQAFTMQLRIDEGGTRAAFSLTSVATPDHDARVFSSGRITLPA